MNQSNMLEGVRCLVLGGGGFIGTHLCRALKKCGAEVLAFGRRQNYPEILENVSWFEGDFSDPLALARAVKDNEIVFHLISTSTPENSNYAPTTDLVTNVVSTLNLIEICRDAEVKKFIFVSSGGTVYGIQSQIPISETAPTNPISAYGINKLTIEKYLHLYQYLHGFNYRILRVANPYGPFQNPVRKQGVIPALLNKAINQLPLEIWGDGEVIRDFIYIDDVIEALILLANYNGTHRVFNVGSGIGRSIRQIVEDIQMLLKQTEIKKIFKPNRIMDVPVNVLDISLIRQEVQWMPRTNWLEGLQKTADWLMQSMMVPS